MVDRLVELAERGVDSELPEERVHTERPSLVGDDGYHPGTEGLVAHEVAEQVGHGHGGGHGPTLGALGQAGEDRRVGQGDRPPVPNSPLGDGPPQGQSPLDHVLVFWAALVGSVVGGPVALQGRFGDLIDQVEPLPEGQQLVLGHLLDLVGGVPCLEALAQRPALDGLGQNHRGGLVLLGGVAVRGVDLLVVVAAPRQIGQLLVREVLDHGSQAGIRPEEVLPDVVATLHGQALVLAVDRGVELVEQDAVHVLVDELVPFGSPDHLQDVPARTPEHALQLLDYLAVAPDRAVQALQVAVDDPDQVAEARAARQGDGAQGLRLVALAVAQEAEHPASRRLVDPAALQVVVEPGVVDGVDGAETHRHGGELPEVGHEPGVRVAGQPLAADLHAEAVQVLLGEAALQEGPGVDAGGGVTLEVDVVTGPTVVLSPEEPVETHLVEGGRRGEGGQVSADAVGRLVGVDHHRGGVPADERPDAALDELIAWEPRLVLGGDGVDVGGPRGRGVAHVQLACPLQELGQHVPGPPSARLVDHGVEGVDPLLCLGRIGVRELVGESVYHGRILRGPWRMARAPDSTNQAGGRRRVADHVRWWRRAPLRPPRR